MLMAGQDVKQCMAVNRYIETQRSVNLCQPDRHVINIYAIEVYNWNYIGILGISGKFKTTKRVALSRVRFCLKFFIGCGIRICFC